MKTEVADLDGLNRQLHRRLVRENRNLPSTAQVGGKLALRACSSLPGQHWRKPIPWLMMYCASAPR
jgi:hypothetical protein